MKQAEHIWHDGRLVPWEAAGAHLLTHSLHYGLAVFDGIRCYETASGPAVFRLHEHLRRLERSARIFGLVLPYGLEALAQATLELIRANGHRHCYIRPLAYLGEERLGLNPIGCSVHVAIITWVWGAYLGEDNLRRGIRCRISSFTRLHPNAAMTKAKCSGNYVNSQLARLEAVRDGYDEAILLDPEGYAVEGSGENLFAVEQGRLLTPPLDAVLPGITRDAVIQLAGELGVEVQEQRLSRDRLYAADEVFLTGTAAEITPVREIDHRPIGAGGRGPLTERLQELFRRVTLGEEPRYAHWLTPV